MIELLVAILTAVLISFVILYLQQQRTISTIPVTPPPTAPSSVDGFVGAIGNTPLIYIRSLSEATGCTILGKAEHLNPGGSIKDRAAKAIIDDAEATGILKPGGEVVEGTVGSTGIALALQCSARGYRCHIFMPNDTAIEKAQLLQSLGARVMRVPPVGIYHPDHYVNLARRYAAGEEIQLSEGSPEQHEPYGSRQPTSTVATDAPQRLFANQFDNLANFRAHYTWTAPELWKQLNGKIDAFVMGAGTGGTIAGIAKFLKEKSADIKVLLVDPPGSGLYNKIKSGVMYASTEAEGRRKRHQTDSIIEGIGINRVVANLNAGLEYIDDALQCSDQEAVLMSRHLLHTEGLFLGSSSAANCVGAVKAARTLPRGSVIVTVLCDSGTRYLSNFYNADFLRARHLDTTNPSIDPMNALNFIR